MRQNFTIAGPFGKLSGVINLCEEELGRRHVLVMAHGFRGSMDGAGRAAALADEIGKYLQRGPFQFQLVHHAEQSGCGTESRFGFCPRNDATGKSVPVGTQFRRGYVHCYSLWG